MIDKFGRAISYLRLSVTDQCNANCLYCRPQLGDCPASGDLLSADRLVELSAAAIRCGIRKIRITGGEPLVRTDILDIAYGLSALPGLDELCLTTNGILLSGLAKDLASAGVDRLNISLDSLDPACYREITRGGSLGKVLEGLEAAQDAGFSRIKINVVLLAGINDREIERLAQLTRHARVDVRFIEVMPVGACAGWTRQHYLPSEQVLKILPDLEQTGCQGVAKLYRLPGTGGSIGLISPMSSHFCPTCNRIRITADGRLKSCLHSADEIDLNGLVGDDLADALAQGIVNKPARHGMDTQSDSQSLRPMIAIGG